MKTAITFEIDTDDLTSFTDQHLADLWHVAQANPAPFGDRDACRVAEYIGREIIRRWLSNTAPNLWSHQGEHIHAEALVAEIEPAADPAAIEAFVTEATLAGLQQQPDSAAASADACNDIHSSTTDGLLATIPQLPEGQHNAGLVMQDGKPSHWLILLPEVPASHLNFQDATAWAESIGGELPTRQEQSLLFANLKDQFEANWYWSGEEYKSDSGYAWIQYFDDGLQVSGHKGHEFRARAVRRLVIE